MRAWEVVSVRNRTLRIVTFASAAVLAAGLLIAPSVCKAEPSACSCPWVGDVNGDGHIDVLDMAVMLDAMLTNGPVVQDPDCPKVRADYNADGVIDVQDMGELILYLFWGMEGAQDPCECESQPQPCVPLVDPDPGAPGNSVTVESKSVIAGAANVPIAISLSNDVALTAVVVPLVAREITPGSFITSCRQAFADRLIQTSSDIRRVNQYAIPDGSCPGGFSTVTYANSQQARPVASSPEAFLFYWQWITNPELAPGTDAFGSLVLTVDVTSTLGTFEIDTTCMDPSTHLVFLDNNTFPIVPSFTKGVITIIANTPPVAVCQNATVSVGNGCAPADAAVDNGSYDPDGGPVTLTQTPPGPYPLGTTIVTLTVEDEFGATAECQATVTVEDHVPPEIVCPQDIFLNIPPVYMGWVVAYQVTATDNCPGDVTITTTHPSGGFFPNGMTEVTCTATDASGNTAQCVFHVTIEAMCYDRLSDVNCDGATDALDLAMIIDILYAGAPPAPPCSNGPQ